MLFSGPRSSRVTGHAYRKDPEKCPVTREEPNPKSCRDSIHFSKEIIFFITMLFSGLRSSSVIRQTHKSFREISSYWRGAQPYLSV